MTGRLRASLAAALPEPALRRIQQLRNGEWPRLGGSADRHFHEPEPEIVHRFDAHETRISTAATVTHALDLAGIPYALLPGPHGRVEQIAVDRADRERVFGAIAPKRLGRGWTHRPRGPGAHRAPSVQVFRLLSAPNGRRLAGPSLGCPVVFWRRVTTTTLNRRANGLYEPGTMVSPQPNPVVQSLSPDLWQRAVTATTHWLDDRPKPSIFEVREPIDIVYAWVDGADPAWQARKAWYEPHAGVHHASATHHSRYIARDELRYSLRSVAMYGDWVRRIHIVTDGQVPPWLNTSHPKIQLVEHGQIFRDPSVLPVFNSHSIEAQLHHTPGLADAYIYFNDDVFFGRAVDPELFFTGNGLSRFFLSDQTVDLGPATLRDLPAAAAAKQNRTLVETNFGVTVRHKYRHGVHPQLREVLVEMEKRYPDEFAEVAASRFRHLDDVSIASSLHHTYAFLRGRAVPGTMHSRYQDIGRPDTARRLDEILRERPQVFCLNEIEIEPQRVADTERVLRAFLDAYFPLPSPYESGAAHP